MNGLISDDIRKNVSVLANGCGRFIAGRFYRQDGRQGAKIKIRTICLRDGMVRPGRSDHIPSDRDGQTGAYNL